MTGPELYAAGEQLFGPGVGWKERMAEALEVHKATLYRMFRQQKIKAAYASMVTSMLAEAKPKKPASKGKP